MLSMAQFALVAALTAGAANAQPAPLAAKPVGAPGATILDDAAASAAELQKATRHSAMIRGKRVDYTAVAGTLTLRDEAGKPTASMFYVAYLLEPQDRRRPVTFFYNGGPGSSTVWLHMASYGPRRVAVAAAPEFTDNPPFRLVDNDESLLPRTDLVFLDAINTGYSRPLGDTKPEAFLSADSDIDAFTQAIQRFLTIHGRWNSPKFLFGESYGTSRSAGVVDRLQTEGVQMNGVIQTGSILDITKILANSDRSYQVNVPTFALTAAHFGKTPRPADRAAFLREVIAWTEGPYNAALAEGDNLPAAEKQAVAEQLSKYIGLPATYLVENNLRITANMFRAQLLRGEGKILGELDSRFSAAESGGRPDEPSFDPSYSAVFRAIIGAFQNYVGGELQFSTPLAYRRAYAPTFGKFDWRRSNGAGLGQYGRDLADAMKTNPKLHVLSLNGYYDLSTPFYGADYDYAHLHLPLELRRNLSFASYDTGHMAYVDEVARRAILAEALRFYDEAAPSR